MPLGKPRPLDKEELKEYAARMLSGRALSVGQLKEKLRRRAMQPEHVEDVVAQLKEYGVLNDSRYAENFAARRAQSGTFGKQRVLTDLMRNKVAGGVAHKAVGEAYAGANETEMVEAWLERKYRGKNLTSLLKEPKELASVFRRLRTAGFSTGPSISVLKRFAAQADELEGLEDEPAN
jgi:regulatory protein